MKKRVYLDVCCLNRPFDDQGQNRIHMEAEAVVLILGYLEKNDWLWVASDVLNFEIQQTPNLERRRRVQNLVRKTREFVSCDHHLVTRANEIEKLGFGGYDALHLASAEAGKADVFLTTDDKLIRRARRLASQLKVAVANPLTWWWEAQDGI